MNFPCGPPYERGIWRKGALLRRCACYCYWFRCEVSGDRNNGRHNESVVAFYHDLI